MIIGRNAHIGWAVTNVGTDVQDLFVIEEDEQDKNFYWANGKKEKFVTRVETISVKGQQSVSLEVKETVFGFVLFLFFPPSFYFIRTEISPVINPYFSTLPATPPVSLLWIANLNSNSLAPNLNDTTPESVALINKAQNYSQFLDALSYFVTPAQNFLFSDLSGNIAYHTSGVAPVRAPGHTGKYPVLSNSSVGWTGFLGFSKMPLEKNPERGFIVSANNKVTADGLPYLINDNDWEPPFRAERIEEMITTNVGNKFSVDDVMRMQMDQNIHFLFDLFKPILSHLDVVQKDWQKRVIAWKGLASKDSQEAAVFEVWYTLLCALPKGETKMDYWNNPFFISKALSSNESDPSCNSQEGGCSGFASRCFDNAVAKVGGKSWGDIHSIRVQSILFGGTALACFYEKVDPNGGDFSSVFVSGYDPSFDSKGELVFPLVAEESASYREILSFADLDGASRYVYPMGQSGDIFSNNFDSYYNYWFNGEAFIVSTVNFPFVRQQQIYPPNYNITSNVKRNQVK